MIEPEQPSLLARFIERLQSKETLDLEYKAARGGLPVSVWETVSAFANTNGGWILLGVSDVGEIEGLPDAHKTLKEFLDQCRNPKKLSHPVGGAGDASVDSIDAKDVVVIRVPAASRRNRPIYVSGNPYSGTFVRRGEGDYRCTKPEVDRMMREASDVAADSSVLAQYGLDDIDAESLASFRRRYQTLHPASPNNSLDEIGFLQTIGAWARDREKQVEGLTVAGLLMLGKGDEIRRWRGRHMIDYRQLGDTVGGTRWLDRLAWEGNLLGAIDAIYSRLTEGIEVPFQLAGATRVEETAVHTAVREAFVNLLVHADYSETSASLVIRSPQEYVFQNPGSSRVPEADLYSGVRSDPRNPALIRMFRLIGLAEEAGTGIPSILTAWRSLGFRIPEIESQSERYEFKLRLRHIHMFSDEDRTWLGRLGRELSEAEQVAMVTTLHEGEIDNLTLRRITGIHPADATKVLVGLRDGLLLVMLGDRRGARYRLGPIAELGTLPIAVADLPDGPAELDEEEGIQPSLWPSLDRSGAGLDSSDPSLDSFAAGLSGFRPKVAKFAEVFYMISEPTRAKHHVPETVLHDVVERLCRVEALSVRELAFMASRSQPTMNVCVRALVKRGTLEPEFPNARTHPAQRYRSLGNSLDN